MCQIQYNQTLKNKSPKIKPKLNRYLVSTKKKQVHKKTQKTDWLMVEDVQVHKWMKKKVPDSKELASGIIRMAFCSMCTVRLGDYV